MQQSTEPLQLTIFIINYELPGPCISFFSATSDSGGQHDQ